MAKLAFIGFGIVGQGFARILRNKRDQIRSQYGMDVTIVAVTDVTRGAVYDPGGLDLEILLTAVSESGSLNTYPDKPGLRRGLDSMATIRESNADVIVEVTWTDLKSGQPAIDHIRTAFEAGKHVITTNKGPLVLAYRELAQLAASKGLFFGFEGTVMSGTPALRVGMSALAGCEITELRGILNGTTNYILTRMETGKPFDEALAEAQELGYAEADPTADIEGWDARGKVAILGNLVLGVPLKLDEISCTGISGITTQDIEQARARGERWKLIGYVRRSNGHVQAGVAPTCLSLSDPLASIGGVTNAITYVTDLLGDVTLIGAGAGQNQTGFALLSDLLAMKASQR